MPYQPYQSTWSNPYMPQVQQYQPAMPSVTQPYQQPTNGTIQVSGPESAMQYGRRMSPNSISQALFDTNGKVFYIVSTDGAGMPSLETFDYSPHKEEPIQIDGAQFVSKQEYDQFVAKVSAALEAIENGVHATVPTAAAVIGQHADGIPQVDAQGGHVGDGVATGTK